MRETRQRKNDFIIFNSVIEERYGKVQYLVMHQRENSGGCQYHSRVCNFSSSERTLVYKNSIIII